MKSIHIIYASTSGHTEYVVDTLKNYLSDLDISVQRAEEAEVDDLHKGDVLLLASSTWNTGSIEGQFNPHMHAFLEKRAVNADLSGRRTAVIGLGDDRYRYTCRAADLLEEFVQTHGGELLGATLRIINEPYNQDDKITAWGDQFRSFLS